MKVWEYKDTVDTFERDDLGKEGWEAYAVTVQAEHNRDGIGRITSSFDVVYFHMRRSAEPVKP